MSSATLCTDCSSNMSFPIAIFNPDNAKLQEAHSITISEYFGNTNSFALPKQEIVNLLLETYIECSKPNWDGYDAHPIIKESLLEALSFIDKLPVTISMPSDISPDPNGYISMEWRKRTGLIFDISFTGNNEIIYAGILGTEKPRGSSYFSSSIPKEIINKIIDVGI